MLKKYKNLDKSLLVSIGGRLPRQNLSLFDFTYFCIAIPISCGEWSLAHLFQKIIVIHLLDFLKWKRSFLKSAESEPVLCGIFFRVGAYSRLYYFLELKL